VWEEAAIRRRYQAVSAVGRTFRFCILQPLPKLLAEVLKALASLLEELFQLFLLFGGEELGELLTEALSFLLEALLVLAEECAELFLLLRRQLQLFLEAFGPALPLLFG
jgi:hypothetical protein